MADVARAIEKAHAALDQLVIDARLVEFELVVGEEPEEGVEFEVVVSCSKMGLTESTPCVLPPGHVNGCHFQAPYQRRP